MGGGGGADKAEDIGRPGGGGGDVEGSRGGMGGGGGEDAPGAAGGGGGGPGPAKDGICGGGTAEATVAGAAGVDEDCMEGGRDAGFRTAILGGPIPCLALRRSCSSQ